MKKRTVKPFSLRDPLPDTGSVLVEASAGTGKTYNLARLYLRLLLEKGLDTSEILTVTFTRAATEELAVRIRSLIRSTVELLAGEREPGDDFDEYLLENEGDRKETALPRLKEALGSVDEAAIYTIHAFCQRALQTAAFESGQLFGLEPLEDEEELKREVARDYWRKHAYPADRTMLSVLSAAGMSPDRLVELFDKYRRSPDIILVPDLEGFEKAKTLLAKCRTVLRKDLPGLEKGAREAVSASIHSAKTDTSCLSASADNYKPEAVDVYFNDLRVFLESGSLVSLRSLEKLTYPEMLEGRTGKYKNPETEVRPQDHPLFGRVQELLSVINDFSTAFALDYLKGAETALKEKMVAGRFLSYQDMLSDLRTALRDKTAGTVLRNRLRDIYKAALIDEFQDTDPVQYAIFDAVFTGRPLFFIGDPKQAIYAFRGADIYTYLDAASAAGDERTLGTNYRSASGVVEGLNFLFGRHGAAMVEDAITFDPVKAGPEADKTPLQASVDDSDLESPVQLLHLPYEDGPTMPNYAIDRALLPFIAEEIKRLCKGHAIGAKPVQPGDVAILVRTHKQGMAVQQELRAHRINSVLVSNRTVFETVEMKELLAFLTAAAYPRNERLVKGCLVGSLWGMSPAEIGERQADTAGWAEIMGAFDRWHDRWNRHGVMDILTDFLAESRAAEKLLALSDGERRYANLLQSVEVINRAASEEQKGTEELLQWIRKSLTDCDRDRDYIQLRLESDADAVKVVTIHKAKGLEFPIVFCPQLWWAHAVKEDEPFIFHDDDHRVHLVAGPSGDREALRDRADRERLAEDMRVLYVAVTRARHRCYIVDGPLSQNYPDSGLAYLLHCPPGAGVTPDAWLAEVKGRVLEPGVLLEDLARIAAESDHIGLRTITRDTTAPMKPVYAALKAGSTKVRGFAAHDQLRTWSISSFSGLTRDSGHGTTEEKKGVDYDAAAAPAVQDEEKPQGIFVFPRGARPGTALHTVFELLEFDKADDKEIKEAVEQALGRFSIAGSAKDVAGMVKTVLEREIPGLGHRLADLKKDDCLKELEFYYPIKEISGKDISRVLEIHDLPGAAGLPPVSGKLEFNPLHGYMRGFIDLVAHWNGKYYLLDWKSNHLGNSPERYGQEELAAVMREHRYNLQYLLYTVALDRYLASRVSGYSYEEHFGGVCYVFLRGVTKTGDTGWFFDRPKENFIEELKKVILA